MRVCSNARRPPCALHSRADDGAGGVLTHMYGRNLTKPKTMDGTAYDPSSACDCSQSSAPLRTGAVRCSAGS